MLYVGFFLVYWCKHIQEIMEAFSKFSIDHIYREHNVEVDAMSKFALDNVEGFLCWEEWIDGCVEFQGLVPIMDEF